MDNEDLIKEINILKAELEKTKNELVETKEHLKKYTAPSNMKKYYQNHKEELKQKSREYKEKTNYDASIPKDRKKEYIGYENNLSMIKDLTHDPESIIKYLPDRSISAWNRFRKILS